MVAGARAEARNRGGLKMLPTGCVKLKSACDVRSLLKLEITSFIAKLASFESSFTASTALMRHGIDFPPRARRPNWLKMGEKRNCFNNATLHAIERDDVLYAKGYAIYPGLPIPVQHAWLVDSTSAVIDPKWEGTGDHIFFGIALRRDFVMSTLNQCRGEAGILVNLITSGVTTAGLDTWRKSLSLALRGRAPLYDK